ncbi:diguanylate cyclase [Modestobacter sp. I12A-02628]|uniref:Diguanylate cyclase n=1 Tax=Goekera deserti TaxID=2497753 RepID=A0A7K3WHU0_9ACTN|nr:sensor domain-containing diguanylate cyclase [Goekera deserti]MPQ97818.1 diguanylate cyclase [Goekera deserti]NDI48463.1 diguanylate cyclase [Goekera deserti]NEL56065.1 diguanylate cyclase [Goekera deserti]
MALHLDTVRARPAVDPDDPDLHQRQHDILARYDLLDSPEDAELDAVVRVAAAIAGVPTASVNVLDTERQCSVAATGGPRPGAPRTSSICHRASTLGRPWVAEDLLADPDLVDHPFVDGRLAQLRLYASVPLVVEEVPIGTLCVYDVRPGALSADQVDRLVDLAAIVVALLERRRQTRESTRLAVAADQARTQLAAVHAELTRRRAFELALLDALPLGVVAADADGTVTLFNRVSREWHGSDSDRAVPHHELAGRYDLLEPDGVTPLTPERIPLVRALHGEHLASGVEMVIAPAGLPTRTVHCLAVPVHDPSGQFLGAVATMSDVTEQRAMEQQLRQAALHDPLTGLPNRSLLVDRLEHVLAASDRDGAHVGVLYCDLDGFKAVNDHHGHATGDAVLREAAARMAHAVRPGDTVGRIGGDEFVVLCPGVGDMATATRIAARIEAALTEPVVCPDGLRHHIGVSVGVALSQEASTPETVLTAADQAMYAVKSGRRAARA